MINEINKEFEICLNEETLNHALNNLKKNDKFLLLGGNLLSISNIVSCFEMYFNNNCKNDILGSNYYNFKFSYNDGIVKKLIKISILLEDDGAYGFLKTSNYLDNEQLLSLVNKVNDIVKSNESVQINSLNNNLYNEALIFVTSGINNNECKNVKDDFESKFKIYQEKQISTNNKIKNMMVELHNKLIDIKVG